MLWLLAAWAILAGLLVLQLLPDAPGTARGWAVLLVLGPPASLALAWGAERLFGEAAGARISSARFSIARIAVGAVACLAALAPLIWWLLREAR